MTGQRDYTAADPIRISIFTTGFTAGLAQLVIIRELFANFSGTEYIIGLVMAGWLVFTGLGSNLSTRLFKTARKGYLPVLQALSGIMLVLTWFGASLSSILWSEKTLSVPGWIVFSLISAVVLIPFCAISGFLFSISSKLLSEPGYADINRSGSITYSLDSAGMAAGFIAGTFIFIPFCNSVKIVLSGALINFLVVFVYIVSYYSTINRFHRILAISVTGVLFMTGTSILFSGIADKMYWNMNKARLLSSNLQEIVDSLYSRITVAKTAGQLNFYINGQVDGSIPGTDPSSELKIHFPMLCNAEPGKIMVVGGIFKGVLDEVVKHKPDMIVYCETDPTVISLSQKYFSKLSDIYKNKIRFHTGDARKLIDHSAEQFDEILVYIPFSSNLSSNRYYTREFFQQAKKALKEHGIFSFCLDSPEVFAGQNQRNRNSSIMNALSTAFRYHAVIPGDEGVIIASNSDFTKDMGKNMEERYTERNLKTSLISPEYIAYATNKQRLNSAEMGFNERAVKTNSDFLPAAVYYQTALQNEQEYPLLDRFFRTVSKVNLPYLIILTFVFASFFAGFNYIKGKEKGVTILTRCKLIIFLSGFSGFAVVLSLIYIYQIIEGSLYGELGILSGAILLGYASGSILATRLKKPGITAMILLWSFMVLFLLVVLLLAVYDKILLTGAVIKSLSIVWGLLCGAVYPLLNQFLYRRYPGIAINSGSLYGYELFGSAAGSVVAGSIMLPLIGFAQIILFIIVLETISLLIFIPGSISP